MRKVYLIIIIAILALLTACDKNTYESSMNLANKYMLDGKYEEAILEFKKAIEIEPNNYEPYEGLVNAYISLDNDETVQGIVDTVKAYYAVNSADERLIDYIIANIGKLPNDKAKEILEQIKQFMPSEKLEEKLKEKSDSSASSEIESNESDIEDITPENKKTLYDSGMDILKEFNEENYCMYDIDKDGHKDIIMYEVSEADPEKIDFRVAIYKDGLFKYRTGYADAAYGLYADPDGNGFVIIEDKDTHNLKRYTAKDGYVYVDLKYNYSAESEDYRVIRKTESESGEDKKEEYISKEEFLAYYNRVLANCLSNTKNAGDYSLYNSEVEKGIVIPDEIPKELPKNKLKMYKEAKEWLGTLSNTNDNQYVFYNVYDINNDGYKDLIGYSFTNDKWRVLLYTETGFIDAGGDEGNEFLDIYKNPFGEGIIVKYKETIAKNHYFTRYFLYKVVNNKITKDESFNTYKEVGDEIITVINGETVDNKETKHEYFDTLDNADVSIDSKPYDDLDMLVDVLAS